MATQPGEENVATLYGDIHYFYGPPTNDPPHHRFDKGSYVYLFENASARRARIEIANQPGTENQDAFEGFLDAAHLRYSYKHSCLVTLTVGQPNNDPNYWHLPTFDPRNENKYHYPLHSLDIYFWTPQDALQFVNGVRRLLPPSQLEILDEPAPPTHQADASSVVQQLENVAISDPAYKAADPAPQAAPVPVTIPAPPPMSAVSPLQEQQQQQQPDPASYAPMAYNPAAPAAPEAVRHREKTPPPDDGGIDPLAQAVAYDAQAPFSPGFVPPPGFQLGGQPAIASPGLPPPPSGLLSPQPGLQRSATMPIMPQQTTLGFQPPPPPPGGPPPQQQPQQQQQQQPPLTPGLQQTTTPPGGYSPYAYAQNAQVQQDPSTYSVHSQFYRPTEEEAKRHKDYRAEPSSGRLEQNAARLEKGVTGMLKKFEKKFG